MGQFLGTHFLEYRSIVDEHRQAPLKDFGKQTPNTICPKKHQIVPHTRTCCQTLGACGTNMERMWQISTPGAMAATKSIRSQLASSQATP
jgi:hypothetical protein